MKHLLIIHGSRRKHSFNAQLADALQDAFQHKVHFHHLDYDDVPFFSEDLEQDLPQSVHRVRKEIISADAIWIITPEYNGHLPGGLKNLLDWLSRPVEKGNWQLGSVVKQKPVTISSAAGKSAGSYVRKNLKDLLERMRMNVIYKEGTGFVIHSEAFASGKLMLDSHDFNKLELQLEALLQSIQ